MLEEISKSIRRPKKNKQFFISVYLRSSANKCAHAKRLLGLLCFLMKILVVHKKSINPRYDAERRFYLGRVAES